MPTYGYRCTTCAHEFERVQKMIDPPIAACEDCGGPVKKILYPVGISFKGSGFYVNDSKPSGGGSKSEANGDGGGGGKGEGKSEGKKEPTGSETPAVSADSKSAATTESKPTAAAESKPAAAASKSDMG